MNANSILQQGGTAARRGVGLAFSIPTRLAGGALGRVRGDSGRGRDRPAPKPGMDDVTIARKAETQVFRGHSAWKSAIDVNVAEGTDAITPAEPSPVEHARTRKGRTPAPFGSTGTGDGTGGSENGTTATTDLARRLPQGDDEA